MAVAGSTIRQPWLYLDAADAGKTGMVSPADIVFVLKRDSGAGIVDASETITWTEKGSGFYEIAFSPLNVGLYTLFLRELNADSFQRRFSFTYEVMSAGSAYLPSFANAFCSEADVARWTQLTFNGTSKPTSTEIAGFAQGRASEMRGALAAEGWIVSPSDTSLQGTIEQDMLRECNAVATAADAWMAKFMDTEPAKSEKAVQFLEEYQTRLTRLVSYAEHVTGSPGISSPMETGEVTLRDETPIQDDGLQHVAHWTDEN